MWLLLAHELGAQAFNPGAGLGHLRSTGPAAWKPGWFWLLLQSPGGTTIPQRQLALSTGMASKRGGGGRGELSLKNPLHLSPQARPKHTLLINE